MASRIAAHGRSPDRPAPPRRGGGFALLSPEFLDELRHRTALSALIGRSVKLQKAGNEYKACCPFHHEKSPSFYVNDDKGFYHCFGCGAHGDAIRFLTEHGGMDFLDAVKQLADAAGLELPKRDAETQARIDKGRGQQQIVGRAMDWFREQLAGLRGAEAREYLAGRGITPATQARFAMGFAPDGRRNLGPALPDVPTPALVEAGLLIQPDDGARDAYDRFRQRLMIPIRDRRGQPIAFGGRIIGAGEPKYLNSPETPLFDKGRTLFNIDLAGPVARKSGRAIVVEGYLDVITLDQAGIGEALAPLGTALTEAQLELLWQMVDCPILCFDGDAAGQRAALRAAVRAMPLLRPGKSLSFAVLPAGQDPDDVVRAGGADAFEALLAAALPLDELLYRSERAQGDMNRPEQRAGLRRRLDDMAAGIADKLVADEYRRSFHARFYDEFGFRKGARATIEQAILDTGRKGPADLTRLFIRSALFGLTRFTDLIPGRIETISAIPIDYPDLIRWRETLVDEAYNRPGIDTDEIRAILESRRLPHEKQIDIRYDLRFPHDRPGISDDQARASVALLVDLLGQASEIDAEFFRLDREIVADCGGDRYLALESARQRLREQKLALRNNAFEFGAEASI